jgi:hypothetical protein
MSSESNDFGRFAPSRYHIAPDYIRLFAGFWTDPERGHYSDAVTHDTLVYPDGSIQVQVNGVPLEEVGERPGSYIR